MVADFQKLVQDPIIAPTDICLMIEALLRVLTHGLSSLDSSTNIKEKHMNRVLLTLALMAWAAASALAADENRQAADEAAIRKSVETYVAAFNKGDAKALAEMWSPEAVYTNPITGEQAVGRAEIEKEFASIFADSKDAKLEAKTKSVKFISPNVAVEEGTAKVIRTDQEPEDSEYTAVYVKRDGQWLLDRVTEKDEPVVHSNYDKLKDLEWMIGTWEDQDEQSNVETTCQWTKNRNFIVRSFAMSIGDKIDMAGMQIVGWDPAAKQIRSWVFDSDGGFGEGVWKKKSKSWYVQATGTLPDGGKTSSVNIIKQIDDSTFTWQSVDRVAGGELLPNVNEVTVVRQTATE
jgi:uncharacterized protein (TIGR02246 family)